MGKVLSFSNIGYKKYVYVSMSSKEINLFDIFFPHFAIMISLSNWYLIYPDFAEWQKCSQYKLVSYCLMPGH